MNEKGESLVGSEKIIDQFNFDSQKISQIERDAFKKELQGYFFTDKYWPKINTQMRIREIKVYKQLKNFERSQRDWVYFHLDCGYPTFYSILGVDFNVNKTQLQKIYKFKCDKSYFPLEIIEEAYKTIKNLEIRSKYNQFIRTFRDFYNILSEEERSELDKKHSEWQSNEKKKIILSLILERHKNWEILYLIGMNLFSISKIKSNFKMQDILSLYEKYSKSRAKMAKILACVTQTFLNSFVYQEYYTFLSLIASFLLNSERSMVINKLQKHWQKFNFTFNDFRDILLSQEPVMEKIKTYESILFKNCSWLKYLPPHKETLYCFLDLDINALNLQESIKESNDNNNSEFRDLLFKKYKIAQKTPETNLAYTILKNPALRADYDWMLKNNLLLMKILLLLRFKEIDSIKRKQILNGSLQIEDMLIQLNPEEILNILYNNQNES